MTVPYRFEVTATTAELRAAHDGLDAGDETGHRGHRRRAA